MARVRVRVPKVTNVITDEDCNWVYKYPNDSLGISMAAAAGQKLPTAENNQLDNGAAPSAIVGFSKARHRSVEDNTTQPQSGGIMPTVSTGRKPATKKTRTNSRKPSPVTTKFEPIVLEFVPEAKRPDTQPGDEAKGALRFQEQQSDELSGILIGVLYNRKDVLAERFKGNMPTGWRVTMEPVF